MKFVTSTLNSFLPTSLEQRLNELALREPELTREGFEAILVLVPRGNQFTAQDRIVETLKELEKPLHSTYVQVIGGGGFFAVCRTCGSEPFGDRQTLAEAEADAQTHGLLEHIYSKFILEHHAKHAIR